MRSYGNPFDLMSLTSSGSVFNEFEPWNENEME